MKKSLMSDEKVCWVCGADRNIECHHVYPGWANRKLSDKYGCTVYLCREHHTGNSGAHMNPELDRQLKEICQRLFEEKYSHEDFMRIFGRNYL